MQCLTCHGRGVIWRPYRDDEGHAVERPEPCPQCGGCGVSHCCDGDQPSARDHEIEQASAYDAQDRALNDIARMGQDCDRQEGEG